MSKYVVALCLGLSGCLGVIPSPEPLYSTPAPSTFFGEEFANFRWVEMQADTLTLCGISTGGTLECRLSSWNYELPQGNDFVRLEVSNAGAGCALDSDGLLACFAKPGSRVLSEMPQGPFLDIAGLRRSIDSLFCGIRETGEVECWGDGEMDVGPPALPFVSLSGSSELWCGVLEDGTLSCWDSRGAWSDVANEVPAGSFDTVEAGDDFACALSGTDVTCWGDLPEDQHPDVPLASVGVGEMNICGVHTDGTGECWGNNGWGVLDVPDGPFVKIESVWEEACGLRPTGELACWGFDPF